MPNDVFRPRLPLDPFGPQPWRVALPPSQSPSSRPQEVILILGAPSYADLAPLTTSTLLANSLLIIATHTPPPVPKPTSSSLGPSIIVLRLPEPLHIHDSGAVRLVNLLDRASRVAHSWKTALLPQPRIQQLAELFPGGDFSISEEPELAAIPQQQQRPQQQKQQHSSNSSNEEREDNSDNDSVSTLSSTASTSSSRFSSRSSFKQAKANSKNATGQAQFSALINFLPAGLPDKSLLKHSVLVTTLAGPFLAPPASSSPYGGDNNRKRNRQSVLSSLSFTSLVGGSTSTSPASSPNRSRSRLSTLFSGPPGSYDHSQSSPPSLRVSPSVESFVTNKVQGSVKRPHMIHVLPYSASTRISVLPLPPSHPLSHERRRSRTYDSGLSSLNPNGSPGPSRGMTIGASKGKERAYESLGPSTKSKLVQSIEQFLLSYAYPPSTSTSSSTSSLPLTPSLPSGTGLSSPNNGATLAPSPLSKPSPQQKRRSYLNNNPPGSIPAISINQPSGAQASSGGQAIVPYVLAAGVLGSSPASPTILSSSSSHPLTIGELILHGALDNIAGGGAGADEDESAFGGNVTPVNWPRAWIGRGGEVEIVAPNSNGGLSASPDGYTPPPLPAAVAGGNGLPAGRQSFLAGGLPASAPPLSVVNSESLESANASSTSTGALVNTFGGSKSASATSSVVRSSPLSSGATTPIHDEAPEIPAPATPNPKRRSQLPMGGVSIPRFGTGSRQEAAGLKRDSYISSSLPSTFAPPLPPKSTSQKLVRGKSTKGQEKEKQKRGLQVPLPTPPDSSSSMDGTSSEGASSTRSASSSSGSHVDDEDELPVNDVSPVEDVSTPIASKFTRGRTSSVATPVKGNMLGLPTPGPSREHSAARSDFTHGYVVNTTPKVVAPEKEKKGLKGKLSSLFGGIGKRKAAIAGT